MSTPSPVVSRRALLKTLGAGAALAAFGRPVNARPEVAEGGVASAPQPFRLPDLPYAYDALAPHFDARTLEIHHQKHHQAYITAANRALENRPDLRTFDAEQLITRLDDFAEPLRTTLRNQLGGHLNHTFFWSILAPSADYAADGPLRAALDRRFGSLAAFQAEFTRAALARFGSGWAWLVWQAGALEVLSTANQDSPLMSAARPIIGLDVWEHAYYLEYQNRRADYVQAFWAVLNWDAAESAYTAAKG